MRRFRLLVVLASTFAMVLPVPTGAANSNPECATGEMRSISEAGPVGFKVGFEKGVEVGLGGAVINCQFRLYDDNGPAAPHVFATDDQFLGGIFFFSFYKDEGIPRADGIADLEAIVDQVYWGPLGGTLEEVEVTVGTMKDNVSPLFGKLLYNHRYVIFEGVEPGDYEWRWEVTAPWTGGVPVVFGAGEVTVVTAP